ncbi:cytochrome c oxidase accessory protein CcoG [Pseudomonas sp. Choline-3u-10]|jgi:cytochrome c oxidase accessory protein FixG|uniref:cytochrome c oxidase accessory protein CcoG n=1 Tax=Pseudomonadaceae TaxID=135621 RepID=UPI000617C5C4|nr:MULTISPECIES: cytochrome c oxidase accessory protein CcoG [Pseudomonadaceae]MAL34954.1 cytochrome c oxidase accessory protein CcoG [Pseudomonas sp.]MBU0950447.1 cytochrome c oxidase accessory protein CcoG [Gammaproteobacteria bacterium]KJJ64941.1 (Fe-S)-binding protein [Pseudomonas sp. 10B238]MBK3795885.1 cytochrome c oxidase accessory protein CcoG [Stutzerimonas stutzeri]MBK3877760.1 cytochrome c oxidase accessory protein CcoG [Stutzerimonas stutzeri]|tara:strand:+ start:491 stop:1903 length:1413 start_codon:yes stop_codon:yes gene_type:complete
MTEQIPVRNVTPPSKSEASGDLYAAREKIYTRAFSGLFRNLRLVGGALLFVLYFGTVWLTWNGRQAVWWDLPERKFYIFGATFWPQDFILLSALLIICAFGLFFITVFAGRVWCGYTCPQSVFTWVFMWAEKVTEGDRNQRMKLDKAPMSADKFLRKAAKHSIWLAVSLAIGITFVGYFTPIRDLVPDLVTLQVGGWALFWVGFFTLATYGNAGYLREQVCIYMCPYARFQSVMFDKDTLIVSYDPRRGERRGPRKKDADYKAMGLGDCIDCTMCVQVCPTGIDIRDGLQIECIGCAACIDACDTIMDKMNYPRGLISYTTEHNLSGQKTHLVRPRLIGYAMALTAMMGVFAYAVSDRALVKLDVLKDRVLYRENEQGRIENVYTLKVMNKAQTEQTFIIEAVGLEGLKYEGRNEIRAEAGELVTVPVELSMAPEQLPSSTNEVVFHIRSVDDSSIEDEAESRFIGPSIR